MQDDVFPAECFKCHSSSVSPSGTQNLRILHSLTVEVEDNCSCDSSSFRHNCVESAAFLEGGGILGERMYLFTQNVLVDAGRQSGLAQHHHPLTSHHIEVATTFQSPAPPSPPPQVRAEVMVQAEHLQGARHTHRCGESVCVPACLCGTRVRSAQGGQKGASATLKLELQVVVRHPYGCWEVNSGYLEGQQVLLTI